MSSEQKPALNVRFPAAVATMARRAAERDGMTLSAWIRLIVDREIARREGRCPSCGQATALQPGPVTPAS